jgi:hypothetical protein
MESMMIRVFRIALLAVACTMALIRAVHTPEVRGSHATGSEFIVDNQHPKASDSNSGAHEDPWLTIQHAADVMTAGDTVLVKPGLYPERVTVGNPASTVEPITFKADPRRSVTMYGFSVDGADNVRIEGFNITTDPSLTGWTERYGVFIRGDRVQVVDNYFFDLKASAVQGYWHEPYPHAAHIVGNEVYRSQKGIGITGYGWLVEGNEVERLFDHGGGDCDYARFFGDDHVIRGNMFHGTRFEEVGSAHVDCFQTFDNNGEFAHDVVLEGNHCTDFLHRLSPRVYG